MGDIVDTKKSIEIKVKGMVVDMLNGAPTKMRQKTITVRMTKDTVSPTISLEDPLRGIIFVVPAEQIIEYYKEE